MLKELVLMERSWQLEVRVVLKVCVCWQESFLCVQGQKRLSFALSFWQRRSIASAGVTQVSDIIRQIDVGLSRFRKMIETLPATVSRVGLEVQTSDLTIMLLRSLPHDVRSYTTLHAAGDAYTDLRTAALRFETQQRMFAELSGPSSSGARGVHALESAETAEEWWGYDQEGYDNSEYAQEEDPDDQWEWDEDAQVWISATVAKGKGSPKSTMKCHLCGRRGPYGQDMQGRSEQGEVFSLLEVWSHWGTMP